MECFAAYLSYTDAQIGRVLEYLTETGDLDNTVIMLCSDNGASSEGGARGSINDVRSYNGAAPGGASCARIDELGGPTTHNNYPWGWTMAGNTPFKRWKREVHEGGVADPCIVRLPPTARRADDTSGIRHQFAHAIDVLPTVLELVGIEPPNVIDAVAVIHRRHELRLRAGRRRRARPPRHAVLRDARLARDLPPGLEGRDVPRARQHVRRRSRRQRPSTTTCGSCTTSPTTSPETEDLAAKEPQRLAEMIELWWQEARRNDVLPLDNRPLEAILHPRPRRRGSRRRYEYRPFGAPVPEASAVHLPNREHTITADVEIGADRTAEGILLAWAPPWVASALYLREGRLRYVHNLYSKERHVIGSDEVVAPGAHELAYAFTKTKGFSGTGRLSIDNRVVGEGEIPLFTPMSFSGTGGGLTCGYEMGPAIGDDYVAPFRCNAAIRRVVVEVSGEHERDPMAVFQAIMSEQ